MTASSRMLGRALWIGLVLLVAGRLLDLQWHASHDESETAGDQVRAHWVLSLGAMVLLVGAVFAVRGLRRSPALTGLLVAAAGYAVVAAWHFYQHSERRETDLVHVLLTVTQIAVFIGAPFAARTLGRQAARVSHG